MSYYFGKLVSNFKGFYNEINTATLTGAIDVVVVEQEDGTFIGGPFHVRFGKLGVLRSREKVLDISINGEPINLHMKLGEEGGAFFVKECTEETIPDELATSPIPTSILLMEEGLTELHKQADEESTERKDSTEEVKNKDLALEIIPESVADNVDEVKDKESVISDISASGSSLPAKPSELSNALSDLMKEPPIVTRPEEDHHLDVAIKITEQTEDAEILLKPSSEETWHSRSIPIPMKNSQGRWDSPQSDSDDLLNNTPPTRDIGHSTVYPLSDMDTPIQSPRSTSPNLLERLDDPRQVLSDTEAELKIAMNYNMKDVEEVTWHWGQLPQNPHKSDKHVQMDSNSVGRKKRTERGSKARKSPLKKGEGLYLDDVLQADREVAALYLNRHPDGDADSGCGQDSKPVSPSQTEDESTVNPQATSQTTSTDVEGEPKGVALSLCGELKKGKADPERFEKCLVTFEEYCKNPVGVLNDPKLVVRIDKKFYYWPVAAPYLMSFLVFGKPIKRESLKMLKNQYMPRKRRGWFSWRSTYDEQFSSDEDEISSKKSERHHIRIRAMKDVDDRIEAHLGQRYKKVTRLTSEQWASLKLNKGSNEITFSVTTQYQGTASCTARIFLWNYLDKIVISDIDGTITKSDVLGQMFPLVGKDWSQTDVTQLYTKLVKNGYRLLYLSARAIGQAQTTRDYLNSVRQDEFTLPLGPMMLNPTSLLNAFKKEVIEKKPEEFKIACLRDIQTLFPVSRNVLYAGFGNRVNDVWAYRAVGIPISRIFTINYVGEIKHELTNAFSSSYTKLVDLVDHMFPPVTSINACDPVLDEYTNLTFWKMPMPDMLSLVSFSDDDEEMF